MRPRAWPAAAVQGEGCGKIEKARREGRGVLLGSHQIYRGGFERKKKKRILCQRRKGQIPLYSGALLDRRPNSCQPLANLKVKRPKSETDLQKVRTLHSVHCDLALQLLYSIPSWQAPAKNPTMDDSASETLKSATPSINNEKSREAEDSVREGSQSPTPNPEPKVSNVEARVSTDSGIKKVHSTTKDVQDELTRVMTSGEGVEYPTGAKLGLISLALCLSVFLMALACKILPNPTIYVLTFVIGQHYYCHCYS